MIPSSRANASRVSCKSLQEGEEGMDFIIERNLLSGWAPLNEKGLIDRWWVRWNVEYLSTISICISGRYSFIWMAVHNPTGPHPIKRHPSFKSASGLAAFA